MIYKKCVACNGNVLQFTIDIYMGAYCASILSDLLVLSFVWRTLKDNKKKHYVYSDLLLLSYEARFVRWYYSRWYWKVLDLFDLQNNGGILQQTIGIQMGGHCASILFDLFLWSYDAEFVRWYYLRWYWKVLDLSDVQNNGGILQHTIGIQMGMYCAPILSNLLLWSYDAEFVRRPLKDNNKKHYYIIISFIYV